jgi:hypothetical protein
MTITYGNLIRIHTQEDTYKENVFFVEKCKSDKLLLRAQDQSSFILDLNDPNVEDIQIVYVPEEEGYAQQHLLFPGKWVEVRFDAEGEDVIRGKIISSTSLLEILTENGSYYIPVLYGLPDEVFSIQEIIPPDIVLPETKTKPKAKDQGQGEEQAEGEGEGELLGEVEEETEVPLFYTREQETNDLVEHLLLQIEEKKRNTYAMKKIYNVVHRYHELKQEYIRYDKGVYSTQLPKDPYLSSFLQGNPLITPGSQNIKIKHSTYEDYDLPSYYAVLEDTLMEKEFDFKMPKFEPITPFLGYIQTVLKPFQSLIVDKNVGVKDQLQTHEEVYLLNELYSISIQEPFVSSSLVVRPRSYLTYMSLMGDTVLKRANHARIPYYDMIFRKHVDDFVVTDVEPSFVSSCEWSKQDKMTWYRNECTDYKEYLQKLMPTIDEFMDCYLNRDFVNFSQALKELEHFKISKLDSSLYQNMVKRIENNIQSLRTKEHQSRKDNMKPVDKPNKRVSFLPELTQDYVALKDDAYYSMSEKMKYGLIDGYQYYMLQFLKNKPQLQLNDEELTQFMEAIQKEFENPQENVIHKHYLTKDDLIKDNGRIVLQDVPFQDKYLSAEEYFMKKLDERREALTHDEMREKLNHVLANDPAEAHFDKSLVQFVKEFIAKTRVVNGCRATVQEVETPFLWKDTEWVEDSCVLDSTGVKVVGHCDDHKREQFKKRVSEMIQTFQVDRLRQEEFRKVSLDDPIHKKRLHSIQQRKLLQDLAYDNEKKYYKSLEQQRANATPVSPYSDLRKRILMEANLELKYKALQLFISLYTKIGTDPNWFYCIETGVKLVPKFLNEIAEAFLRRDDYVDTLQRICDRQGVLSDQGDYYVDKYSGYPIKSMAFDDGEDYTESGFKDVYHEVIASEEVFEKELTEDEQIQKTALLTLVRYAGFVLEETETRELLERVRNSALLAGLEKKKGREQQQIYLYSLITHVLVYLQTMDLKKGTPMPHCKRSLAGFPLEEEEKLGGLDFVACIAMELAKGTTAPWAALRKVPKEMILQMSVSFLKKYVLEIQDIKDQLEKRREAHVETEPQDKETFPWPRFSPRLYKFAPMEKNSTVPGIQQQVLSFRIQHKINEHVKSQDALLANRLVNTCCYENNDTLDYFLKYTSVATELSQFKKLIHATQQEADQLQANLMYSSKQTQRLMVQMTGTITDETIYKGIIQWFSMDAEFKEPTVLKKYGITLPPDYNKKDSLAVKIEKLKRVKPISEDLFMEMLRDHSNKMPKFVSEDKEVPVIVEHPIDQWIRGKKEKDLVDFCEEETERKILSILGTVKEKKFMKDYDDCLRINTRFKSEKKNGFLPAGLEHTTFMTKILLNKIDFILFVLPQKLHNVSSFYKGKVKDNLIPTRWNLNRKHKEVLEEYLEKYDKRMYSFVSDKEVLDVMDTWRKKEPVLHFARWIKLDMTPKSKRSLYNYIFVSLLHELNTTERMKQFLHELILMFDAEDKTALNFDPTYINYLSDMSKKSEVSIKTETLKEMTKEARKAQNALKDLKLGEWGLGLGKSIFKYDKNVYEDVYEEAMKIEKGMDKTAEETETFGTYGLDDGENKEGNDGDEYY